MTNPTQTDKTPRQEALDLCRQIIDDMNEKGVDAVLVRRNTIKAIQQALEAQAEKDRVMEVMVDAVTAAQAHTPYHGKLNDMAHTLYDKALQEHAKIKGE